MFKHQEALQDSELKPLWHDPAIMPDVEPPLAGEETCELLIVGGGFTGLWAALQARERKPDADIIVIEQTFVGDGASGRNGGFLSSSIAHGETNTEAQFPGEEEAIEALGRQNITELLETLERYGKNKFGLSLLMGKRLLESGVARRGGQLDHQGHEVRAPRTKGEEAVSCAPCARPGSVSRRCSCSS